MKAIVEIKGGFGNQIFQYSFANYLKNIGYNVTVNINKSNVYRFPLDSNHFGFKQTNKLEVSFFKFLYFVSQKSIFNISTNKIMSKFFRKEYNFDSFLSNKNCYLNHFDGYWQNMDVIKNQRSYLFDSLKKVKIFNDNLDSNTQQGTTLIHVRRGDYVNVGENLSIEFYKEAIEYCKNKIDNFSFEVFTDDPDWVIEQNIFKDAKAVHGPKDNGDELLFEISKMFKFENFVVGNSTFSLIPALLSKSETSIIIVADPWMKNSKRDLNFDESLVKITNY